jgi:hypothetical protein
MYVPASELQQYRGQFACPYCVQDLRDADRKSEERVPEKPHLEAVSLPEQCERCGRDLEGRVYILNDRKLCRSCVNDEQEKWGLVGGGPMAAPYKITLEPEKKRRKTSLIEAVISDALHLLGVKREKNVEIVVVGGNMPIAHAKPLAEGGIHQKKAERKPEAEGIMPLKGKGERPFELEGRAAPAAQKKAKAGEAVPEEKVEKKKKRKAGRKGAKDAQQDVLLDREAEKKTKQ